MFEVKRMVEADKEGFRMNVIEIKFFENEAKSEAIDCLISWTSNFSNQIVVMGYRQ